MNSEEEETTKKEIKNLTNVQDISRNYYEK